jgi:hypothetical protein
MEENKVEEPHAQITVHRSEKRGDLNVIITTGEIGPFDGAAFVMKISTKKLITRHARQMRQRPFLAHLQQFAHRTTG